jgi:hypothetical protein
MNRLFCMSFPCSIGVLEEYFWEDFMKRWYLLGLVALSLALFVACGGSENAEMEDQMHGEDAMASMPQTEEMKSSEEWIREEPVDVKAFDLDQDGFVYQDQMCWNVIADEAGKCPKCGMILEKVSIDEAVANLKENGFSVQ